MGFILRKNTAWQVLEKVDEHSVWKSPKVTGSNRVLAGNCIMRNFVGDLRLSQVCCCGQKSFGMLRRVVGYIFTLCPTTQYTIPEDLNL